MKDDNTFINFFSLQTIRLHILTW